MESWMTMLADEGVTPDKIVAGVCERPKRWHDDPPAFKAAWPSPEFFAEMERSFDCGFGTEEGCEFTVWTADRVYFPVCYDGREWVGSAPRHPCDEVMDHQGGG